MKWYTLDLNPEPWRVGPVGVGRRGGRMYGYVGPDAELKAYQEAVRELLEDEDTELLTGDVRLVLLFWRCRDEYKTHQARTARKNEADLTNLQKAIEDAVQEVLIKNDRQVREVSSVLMAQDVDTEPKVILGIEPWDDSMGAYYDRLQRLGYYQEAG